MSLRLEISRIVEGFGMFLKRLVLKKIFAQSVLESQKKTRIRFILQGSWSSLPKSDRCQVPQFQLYMHKRRCVNVQIEQNS